MIFRGRPGDVGGGVLGSSWGPTFAGLVGTTMLQALLLSMLLKYMEKDFKGSNTVNRGIFRDKMQNVLQRVNKVALWFLLNVILGDT